MHEVWTHRQTINSRWKLRFCVICSRCIVFSAVISIFIFCACNFFCVFRYYNLTCYRIHYNRISLSCASSSTAAALTVSSQQICAFPFFTFTVSVFGAFVGILSAAFDMLPISNLNRSSSVTNFNKLVKWARFGQFSSHRVTWACGLRCSHIVKNIDETINNKHYHME